MDENKEANPDFHHVVLSVESVKDEVLFRTHQTIVATVSVKMDILQALELHEILAHHIESWKAGEGLIMFTLEGKFT